MRRNRAAKLESLKLWVDILNSRNTSIAVDRQWYRLRGYFEAVEILDWLHKKNSKKIARLERRISRIQGRNINQGQHVLNPKYKEKN